MAAENEKPGTIQDAATFLAKSIFSPIPFGAYGAIPESSRLLRTGVEAAKDAIMSPTGQQVMSTLAPFASPVVTPLQQLAASNDPQVLPQNQGAEIPLAGSTLGQGELPLAEIPPPQATDMKLGLSGSGLSSGLPSSRLGLALDSMKALGEKIPGVYQEQTRQLEAAGNRYAGGIEATKAIYNALGDEIGERAAMESVQAVAQQATFASMQETHQQKLKEAESVIDDSMLEALYPNVKGGADEIKKLKDYAAKGGSEEMRKQAQKQLDEGSEMDPERYMKNMSIGRRILTAIAVGMGGYAQGMGAGPNAALGILNKAIDRDVAAQKDRFDRAKGKVNVAQNNYARMFQRFGNEEQAFNMERARQMAASARYLELKQAQFGTSLDATKAQTFADQIRLGLAEKLNETARMGLAAETQNAAQYAGAVTNADQLALERKKANFMMSQKQAEGAGRIKLPRNVQYAGDAPAPITKKQGEDLDKFMNAWKNLKVKLDRARELRGEFGWNPLQKLNFPLRAEMSDAKTELVDAIRNYFEWGAKFEVSEEKLLKGRFGDDLYDLGWVGTRLDEFARSMDKGRDAVLSNLYLEYNEPRGAQQGMGESGDMGMFKSID